MSPHRPISSAHRFLFLLDPILSPLQGIYQHPQGVEAASNFVWEAYLKALGERLTLCVMLSGILLGVSGTCCTIQSKFVPSIIARLALSESCFAKLLSIVMKMHIRELQRMDIALVRKSWTSITSANASSNCRSTTLLLQAPLAAITYATILVAATVIALIASNSAILNDSADSMSTLRVNSATPLWFRISLGIMFIIRGVHCVVVCGAFLKLGIPLTSDENPTTNQIDPSDVV